MRLRFCLTVYRWPNHWEAVSRWVQFGAGSHGSTYGGSPLGCAVALRILEVIRAEKLADNARRVGELLRTRLNELVLKYPTVLRSVRGLGLMLGIELAPNIPHLPGENQKTQAVRLANLFHAEGLLTIPAGAQILRLLPPLNLRESEAEEGLAIVERVAKRLVGLGN